MVRLRVHALQQCLRDEHTQTRYSRSFVVRDSLWSAHRWLNELNADCAISKRWRTSASSHCSLLPRYLKCGTFSKGGSLPMITLSRDASAARLLLDLTALSVHEPTRDRCVRPPSHQRMFRPRSLVNSRAHDSHLCTRLICPKYDSCCFFINAYSWFVGLISSITDLLVLLAVHGIRSSQSSLLAALLVLLAVHGIRSSQSSLLATLLVLLAVHGIRSSQSSVLALNLAQLIIINRACRQFAFSCDIILLTTPNCL